MTVQGFEIGSVLFAGGPSFINSLKKFVGWLEALSDVDENKGLNAKPTGSLLKEIEDYWDKNYLNFALGQMEKRRDKMDRMEFVERHRHVGRNDPCPCGSGKKFKKCCLQ